MSDQVGFSSRHWIESEYRLFLDVCSRFGSWKYEAGNQDHSVSPRHFLVAHREHTLTRTHLDPVVHARRGSRRQRCLWHARDDAQRDGLGQWEEERRAAVAISEREGAILEGFREWRTTLTYTMHAYTIPST